MKAVRQCWSEHPNKRGAKPFCRHGKQLRLLQRRSGFCRPGWILPCSREFQKLFAFDRVRIRILLQTVYFQKYGNGDLLINSIDRASKQDNLINLTPKQTTERTLILSAKLRSGLILLGFVFLLPAP
jgi:hypothetical protein